MKTITKVTDLTPDPANANSGTLRGAQLLERSLEHHGAGRSVLADQNGIVIAGNKTLEQAAERGFGVKVVQTDGRRLVVVQRTDLDLDDPEARALAYLDNRTSEVGLQWNPAQLAADIATGLDLGGMFTADDRDALFGPPAAPPKALLLFDDLDQVRQWQTLLAVVVSDASGSPMRHLIDWCATQMTRLAADASAEARAAAATVVTPTGRRQMDLGEVEEAADAS